MMKKQISRKSLASLARAVAALSSIACLNACSSTPAEPVSTRAVAQGVTAKTSLYAFELSVASGTLSDIGDRTGRLAAAFGNVTAETARASFVNARSDSGSVHVDLGQAIKASHVDDNDALLLVDESVTRDMASKIDVGEAATNAVFLTAYQGLLLNGAINATGLDASKAKLSLLMQGEGVSGQAPVERVKEYVRKVPRLINGIEVFNSGVQISVHRNGKLARVQAFGPVVSSTVQKDGTELPTAVGYSFEQGVDEPAASARAKSDFPTATVKAIGLRYWLPAGVSRAVVVPQYMYQVSETATFGGQTVHARAKYVGYSTVDGKASATIWPSADPNAKGDARP